MPIERTGRQISALGRNLHYDIMSEAQHGAPDKVLFGNPAPRPFALHSAIFEN
jgi:hypothetical protein